MKPTRPGVNWRLWLVVLWLLTDWKVSGFIPYFCRLQVSVGDMLCHARYNHLFTCVFEQIKSMEYNVLVVACVEV